MKAKCARMEIAETGANISVPQVEQMQHMMKEFAAITNDAQNLLIDLHAKMDALAQWLRTSHNDCVGGLLGNESPTEWVWGAKPRILCNIKVKDSTKSVEREL